MSEVFVLCNQHGAYLNKHREWITYGDTKGLFRSDQRDELINEKVELTVKAPELRIKVIAAIQSENGRILIDGDECLPRENPNAENQDQILLDMEVEQTEHPQSDTESSESPALQEDDHVLDNVIS